MRLGFRSTNYRLATLYALVIVMLSGVLWAGIQEGPDAFPLKQSAPATVMYQDVLFLEGAQLTSVRVMLNNGHVTTSTITETIEFMNLPDSSVYPPDCGYECVQYLHAMCAFHYTKGGGYGPSGVDQTTVRAMNISTGEGCSGTCMDDIGSIASTFCESPPEPATATPEVHRGDAVRNQ